MPANLENSAVSTGLGKISFHSNTKEGHCLRILKLSHNCTHFTYQQGNAQNKTRLQQYMNQECTSWIQKRQRNYISNCQHFWIIEKAREFQKQKIYFCFIDYAKAFDCVDHNKLWKLLKEMGTPDHLTCLLRNMYAG